MSLPNTRHRAGNAVKDAKDRTIANIKLTGGDTMLVIYFDDERRLEIEDCGQSCCEDRYMHTDDDLDFYIGATFLDARIEDGPIEKIAGEYKECQFLLIDTSKGTFTVANYNEHNGYYGGFDISAAFWEPPPWEQNPEEY